jgi:predicted transcriptional regulator of viral defense system
MSQSAGISQTSRAELSQVVRGRRFVTPSDAGVALGVDDRVAARKLARWAEAGWMRRVRRGLYIPVPVDVENPGSWAEDAMVVATTVWEPCYFTGWTAANHWGLTEQTFRTVVLKTTVRVRHASVEILNRNYLVTHVPSAELAWGLTTIWYDDVRLRIADPARTVIDVLDMPKLGGGIRHSADILIAYLAEHDPSRLVDYAERLNNRAVYKRLGYLLEQLGRAESALIEASQTRISSGISLLDPDGPETGERNARWRLRVNARISKEDAS